MTPISMRLERREAEAKSSQRLERPLAGLLRHHQLPEIWLTTETNDTLR